MFVIQHRQYKDADNSKTVTVCTKVRPEVIPGLLKG